MYIRGLDESATCVRYSEQHPAVKRSIAALGQLQLDSAEDFAGVIVGDEEASKQVTAVVQEGCIPQELQHPPHCHP
jgi:hypothetical protein